MTKINDIQILDDIELENVVGGAQEMGKKMMKKVKKAHKKYGDRTATRLVRVKG